MAQRGDVILRQAQNDKGQAQNDKGQAEDDIPVVGVIGKQVLGYAVRHGEPGRTMAQYTNPIPFAGTARFVKEAGDVGKPLRDSKTTDIGYPSQPEAKSPGKAFFYSILLPGAGQFYAESDNSAVLFLGAEALLWLGLVGNNLYADHLVDEYRAYAVQHAGVLNGGKDNDYWAVIGKYEDIYSYNEQRRRERRFDEVYEENTFYYWSWDSKTNRYNYDRSRLQANEIADREVYFWGAIALNHLASAIHALAMARSYNKALEKENMSWNFRFESRPPHKGNGYLGAALSVRF